MSHSGWYLAEIVLRFDVLEERGAMIHVNSVLIAAGNDEAAFEKAMEIGRRSNSEYTNTNGQSVQIRFLGLRDLYYIYDGLYDGAELVYEELRDLTDDQILAIPKEKRRLAVFATAES